MCYALPITGVNHVRISGYDRYGCWLERLTRWQSAAQAVPARAGWIALPARHARVRVSHGLECGSHAAAPAVLTIRRVAYRSPFWSRGAESARADPRVGQACMRYLHVEVLLHQVRACAPTATVST